MGGKSAIRSCPQAISPVLRFGAMISGSASEAGSLANESWSRLKSMGGKSVIRSCPQAIAPQRAMQAARLI